MSKWVDRISNHQALLRLRKISELVAALRPAPSPEHDEALERLATVAEFAVAAVSATDPVLVPPQVLANLVPPTQEIENQLAQFRANKTAAPLDAANNQADNILAYLAGLRPIALPEDAAAIRTAAQTLRKSASQLRHGVEEERRQTVTALAALRKQLEDTKVEITAQKARLDTAIATFQAQFSKAEEERRSAYSLTMANREQETAATLDAHRAAQKDLAAEAKNALAEMREEAASSTAKALSDLQSQAAALLASIQAQERKARELVFLTANNTTVGNYKTVADKQQREGLVWRILAAAAFAGLIVFGIWAFVHASAPDSRATWLSVSGRIFAALAFGLLGAFAAREANRFAQGEERNRKTELALAALGPYLQGLPDELQNEVRRDVARSVFMVPDSTPDGGREEGKKEIALPAERQMEVVEKVLETLQKLIGQLK